MDPSTLADVFGSFVLAASMTEAGKHMPDLVRQLADSVRSRRHHGRMVTLNEQPLGVMKLRSKLERGALRRQWREHGGKRPYQVRVMGTMYPYVPIFSGAFETFEKLWCTWLSEGKTPPLGANELESLRHWYLLSLFQWGFSAEIPGIIECKSGRYRAVGLAQVDEINGIHVLVSDKAWPRLALGRARRARNVTVEAQICAVDEQFKDEVMGGILSKLGVEQLPGIGSAMFSDIRYLLFVDEPSQISQSDPAEFLSAYVWAAFETPVRERYVVWEFANIANSILFEHAVRQLLRKTHDVYRRGDKLVAWVESTVRDAVKRELSCPVA
jgi:hypothetical protein